jgi:hypothetical protein
VERVSDVGYKQVVKYLKTAETKEKIVPEVEWRQRKGFVGELIWMPICSRDSEEMLELERWC